MIDMFDRMKYIESTICVEVGKTYDCPITGISFGEPYHLANTRHTYEKLTYYNPGKVYHPFEDIYFTKSNYQLPITTIKVDIASNLPCLDPSKRLIDYEEQVVYAGEVAQPVDQCISDSRY